MSTGEFLGYLASILTFMTFYMKTMVPLRIVAMLANCVFLAYAIVLELIPVIYLHSILLPVNLFRLMQVRSRISVIREKWKGHISLEELLPFMTQTSFRKGEVLFRKDDDSREMYFVIDGVVRMEEINKTVGPGELFGEIGMFSPDRQRTATAICESDVTLLRMNDQRVLELYNQNPSFGFYLVRLITGRLIETRSTPETPAAADRCKVAAVECTSHSGDFAIDFGLQVIRHLFCIVG